MQSETFFVISRYSEDVSWLKDYNIHDYIIYNKGAPLSNEFNELILSNVGNNQRDIFEYIVNNYDNIPKLTAFIQGYPFDHCKKEKFDKILNNKSFTALESQEDHPITAGHKKSDDGQYMEINTSWYINAHYNNWGNGGHKDRRCQFNSFDSFMHSIFVDYSHLEWLRFAPGSQYIVEQKQILRYSKKFWEHLMNILCENDMTEGHILERACWYILKGIYTPIDELI